METDTTAVRGDVSRYSVLVGFILIVIFVVPCVMFALLAKFFQSPDASDRRRGSTFRSIMGSLRFSLDTKEEGLHRTYSSSAKKHSESDSSGYGAFGVVELLPDKLDCIEKIVAFKTKLACIETWKCYAPTTLEGTGSHGNKKLITIRKLGSINYSSDREHNACLRAELDALTEIPAHHFLLNLLGVCVSGSTGVPHAIMLEFPTFGSLHTFLVCKRRGKISGSTNPWGGLQLELPLDQLVLALPERARESLSSLLDDPVVRKRPFQQVLKEPICDVDQLLFALQIAHGMRFLASNGILHKRLSSENVVISHGFWLKLTGMDFDPPSIHQGNTINRLKRTASGRNMLKWDAPEVIDTNMFSEKSEVWRFGMTMWEIASLGDAPYAELPNRVMTELVKKGEKPPMPDGCSQQMYSLMDCCWTLSHHERPSFVQVITRIKEMLKAHQTLRSLHIDLSPSASIQTATTPLDCASPVYYWTADPSPITMATTSGAIPGPGSGGIRESGRSGSFRRPHPCSIPVTQSAYKRLPQRPSTSSSYSSTASPSATMQLLSFDDNTVTVATEQSRSQLPPILDGYVETDV